MHRGYFAVWRKIQDHPFYREPREFSKYEAWLDLLMEAQHETEPQRIVLGMNIVECNYGECIKSMQTWAERWMWSRSKVFRFLKLLKKMGQIDTESETITTRIKIINYESYDPKRNGNETQVKRRRNASETQVNTDNNEKNDKNDKNVSKGVNTPLSKECSFDVPESYKNCPQKEIIEAYHQHLPQLPTIQVWDDQSAKRLRQRWRQDPKCQSIDFWVEYFKWVAQSRFLMGQVNDFQADLHWLVRPTNFAKVINGRYHNKKTFHERIREVGEQWLKEQETNDS
jgi:hypothetical protein